MNKLKNRAKVSSAKVNNFMVSSSNPNSQTGLNSTQPINDLYLSP